MQVLFFLLLLAGLICFAIAAFVHTLGRVNLVALGLTFWILVSVITAGEAAFVG